MTEVVLRVLRVGSLSTVQDSGRVGFARYGVTEGGPMDRVAHRIGQALLDNPPGVAGLEIDVQGIALQCVAGAVDFVVTGGEFAIRLDGATTTGWAVASLQEGQVLDISMHRWGNWCYVSFSGEVESEVWFGSRSVNPGWSVSGSKLKTGDEIRVSQARYSGRPLRGFATPVFARPSSVIRVVPGPQERFFAPGAFARFYGETFTISSQYNRQGIRLDGPGLPVSASLDMPSEPIVRGSIQVDGTGQASVLMADHQTTGGYPKIATVISVDQDRLTQIRPRGAIRFAMTTPEDGIARLRRRETRICEYMAIIKRNLARGNHRATASRLYPWSLT